MTREREYTDRERDLIASGDMFADDDPIWLALKEAVKSGDSSGVTIGRPRELSRDEEVVADVIRAENGLGPTVVRRESPVQVMVSITPTSRETLRSLAEGFGWYHGGHGNLSMLLEAIGQGKLQVVPTPDR